VLIQASTQYSVMVPNKPGELARITSALLEAGINLDGIASIDVGSSTCVKFIAEPAQDVTPALRAAGYAVCAAPVLRLWAQPMPDFINRVALELARGGIAVTSFYGHCAKDGANYVLAVDKPREAAAALARIYESDGAPVERREPQAAAR
jgi:hypothetical protein